MAKQLLSLIFCAFISNSALAGVIYRWETLTTSPTILSAVGEIEITDAAQASGLGSYTAPPNCRLSHEPCSNADPLSPITRFYFRVNASAETGADIDLNFALGTGTKFPRASWFDADFSITNSLMNLNLFANTGETNILLTGNTIAKFGSDAPYFGSTCFDPPGCSGATGQWAQVPEPPALLLLGVGLLALIFTRRHRPLRT